CIICIIMIKLAVAIQFDSVRNRVSRNPAIGKDRACCTRHLLSRSLERRKEYCRGNEGKLELMSESLLGQKQT
ncbi:MAG TPA: hypothetical protein QF772_10455, partial [Nitrospinaceae bacterium]|nr:hypothetical protein [Nitrospinaceae bacterium]